MTFSWSCAYEIDRSFPSGMMTAGVSLATPLNRPVSVALSEQSPILSPACSPSDSAFASFPIGSGVGVDEGARWGQSSPTLVVFHCTFTRISLEEVSREPKK